MRDRLTCPTCGHGHYEPFAAAATWSDDCACSDRGRCVSHQVNVLDGPDRPSDDVMRERGAVLLAARKVEWAKLAERIRGSDEQHRAEIQRIDLERARLRAALIEALQMAWGFSEGRGEERLGELQDFVDGRRQGL